ncbi:MAG: hypothetical protein ACOC98_04540 [Thermodesulfobacteriota bacterium]
MESACGDRLHEPVADLRKRPAEIVRETADRGGTAPISSFACGRAQGPIYPLDQLQNAGAFFGFQSASTARWPSGSPRRSASDRRSTTGTPALIFWKRGRTRFVSAS